MNLNKLWKSITIGMVFFFSFVSIALAEDIKVTVLNVGQADSILIQSDTKTVLIDAGEQKVDVANQLQSKGIGQIDLVVATHPHADHIGGMEEVVNHFNIKTYMDNGFPHTSTGYNNLMEAAESKVAAGQMKYITARQGQKLNLTKDAYFEILWPNETGLSGTRSDLNANSVVMKLTHGDVCFLFMGDSEAETEMLVADQINSKCQVLKVSHHGSKHSSIPELINKVQPEVALISCGLANKHGHPGQPTLDLFQSMGTKVFRTDLMGELTVVSNGKTYTVASEHAPIKLNKININLADASVLKQLPGVGDKTAEQIIEYRSTNGYFKTVEEVLNVAKGDMNKKRIEKIIPFITVEGGSTTSLIAEDSLPEKGIFPSLSITPPIMLRVVPLRNIPAVRVVIPAHHYHTAPAGTQKNVHPKSGVSAPLPPQTPAAPAQTTTPASNNGMININTADANTLAQMPGMTKSKAQAAVEHRDQHGPFKSCNALVDVKGIGVKTVEKLLSVCTVN